MRDKKKTNIKVRDLQPKKDARGGRHNLNQATQRQSVSRSVSQSVSQGVSQG
jgi:hypothetical protein